MQVFGAKMGGKVWRKTGFGRICGYKTLAKKPCHHRSQGDLTFWKAKKSMFFVKNIHKTLPFLIQNSTTLFKYIYIYMKGIYTMKKSDVYMYIYMPICALFFRC